MKKVLGLISSPRKKGNSEIMTKEIMLHTGSGNQFEMLRLPDLHVEPCKGCYACMKPGRKCPREDDLEFLFEKIADVDGIVLSSPVYHWGFNIGIARILDRGFVFKERAKVFAKKPCVTFVTYGLPYEEGYALSALNAFARILNLLVKDSAAFLGGSPGEVLRYDKNMEEAERLGQALFDPSHRRERGRFQCPNCFSNMIKVRSTMNIPSPKLRAIGQLECAFCGTAVEMRISGNEMTMDYRGTGLYDEDFPARLAAFHQTSIESFKKGRKELSALVDRYDAMEVKVLTKSNLK
jgi:multimeric flavodoxin WrbA